MHSRRIRWLMIGAAILIGCGTAPAAPGPGPSVPATLAVTAGVRATATLGAQVSTALVVQTTRVLTMEAETRPAATPIYTPRPTALTPTAQPVEPSGATPASGPDDVTYAVEVVASDLQVPWALAFGEDGALCWTERPGRLKVLRPGAEQPETLAELPVAAIGEGGLMGLALDPAWATNRVLYLMYTVEEQGQLWNRIARYHLAEGLDLEQVLVERIPGGRNHNGGRLAFGPDGLLYATTGDAGRPALAQDLGSLAGKILRLNTDGSVPEDNPFPGSLVYSYGHRNPQGLAWHPQTGVLYSVEHGPTGEFGSCCRDELNRIVAGGNYGWPWVAGYDVLDPEAAATASLIAPVASSGTETWAPASLAFYRGVPLAPWNDLAFITMLRGSDVQRVTLGGVSLDQVTDVAVLLDGAFGRIRDVAVGPDGYLYLSTSNQDGRGWPYPDDDRVLRIVPAS